MPHITPEQAGSRNMCAYLDTLAFAEIGSAMLAASDDGYDPRRCRYTRLCYLTGSSD